MVEQTGLEPVKPSGCKPDALPKLSYCPKKCLLVDLLGLEPKDFIRAKDATCL